MHKIWVADDDGAIRAVLEESFSSSGFDVRTFSSGDDVVTELKTYRCSDAWNAWIRFVKTY